MPKARIFWNGLNDKEKQELIELLKAIGCEVILEDDEHEDTALAPKADHAEDEEVLVVVLNDACTRDPALAQAAKRLTAAGGRLVGVWPKGAKDGEVPSPLERYGADVVAWDRNTVARAIEGKKEPHWETAEGASRAEPTTKRHRC